MKALLITWGSRGDVQPFLALAAALQRRGHDALVLGPPEAQTYADSYSIPYVSSENHIHSVTREIFVHRTDFYALRRLIRFLKYTRSFQQANKKLLDDSATIADQGLDVVIHHHNYPFHQLAESLNIPAISVNLSPGIIPTSKHPNPMYPYRVPRFLNRATYMWPKYTQWSLSGITTSWRTRTLSLPRKGNHFDPLKGLKHQRVGILQPFSTYILPPSEFSCVHTTGHWLLPTNDNWQPPAYLEKFIQAGEPPVYVGFGSVVGSHTPNIEQAVVNAIRAANVRAVFVVGEGGIRPSHTGQDILQIDGAPFDWLFPRVSAILHHGGTGTTGVALASGKPQIICHGLDCRVAFTADRMYRLGVASEPMDLLRNVAADQLAHRIRQVLDDKHIVKRALDIGEKVRQEPGVEGAVQLIEEQVNAPG